MIPPLPIIKDFIGNATEVQLIKEAISSEEYASSPNFCSQIGVICSYVRTDEIRISYSKIGAMFGKSKQCINYMHKNYIRGIGQEGRPPFLNNEELNQLKEYIYKLHTSEPFPIYPTIEEISSFIIDNFGKYLRHDTIRKMISTKFIDDFKSYISVAMETKRMEATIIDIENNLKELKEKIELVPFPFIFNLDEKGEQQYADAFEKSVIVPASYEFITAPYAVSRTGKRASVLTCISPNGLMCQPQYAVPRLTVDSEIFHYIPSSSIQIVHTKNGFINTKSFIFWFKTCFLEKLKDLRLFHNYFGPAVLILDGYKSH